MESNLMFYDWSKIYVEFVYVVIFFRMIKRERVFFSEKDVQM